jgi:hypothetical protein
MLVDLLRGLCALQIPGAADEAREHLSQFTESANSESHVLFARAEAALKLATTLEAEASRMQITLGPAVGGLAATPHALARMKRNDLLRQAQVARFEAEEASPIR